MSAKKEVTKITGLFLGWRVVLFIVGFIADNFLKYQPSFPYAFNVLPLFHLPRWIYSWAGFDGVHYLTIVKNGYLLNENIQAFFPLFPIIIRFFNFFINNSLLTALIISNVLTLLCLILFYKLLRLDLNKKTSFLVLIVFLLFPSSFFLGAVYTESLFLCLVFSSLIFARKKHWLLAGILAAFASSTRIIGILLVPALLVELFFQQKKINSDVIYKNLKNISYILLGALGLISYMTYLELVFRDFIYFFHVQSEFGAGRQEKIIFFPQVVWRYIKIFKTVRPINLKFYAYVLEFLSANLGLAGLLCFFKKIRPSYLVFAVLALIMPTLTGNFSSMTRYILVCFPIFILIAQFIQSKRIILISYLSISVILLIINTMLFIQGYWIA